MIIELIKNNTYNTFIHFNKRFITISGKVETKNPKEKNGWTPLHDAALNGYQDVCRFILENVADKNPEDDCGNTPLHEAAANGHLDVFRYIIIYSLFD